MERPKDEVPADENQYDERPEWWGDDEPLDFPDDDDWDDDR